MKRTDMLRTKRIVSEVLSFTTALFLLLAALVATGGPTQ